MMIFCSNCESEAVAKIIVHDNGDLECPLCQTCKEAFEWGQASPESTVVDLGEAITHIRVTQIAVALSDHEDTADMPAGPNGLGSSLLYDVPPGHQIDEDSALDWFHDHVPIGCLDDFEIECVTAQAFDADGFPSEEEWNRCANLINEGDEP